MPGEFLDRSSGSSAHRQVRAEGVPQHLDAASERGLPLRPAHRALNHSSSQWRTVVVTQRADIWSFGCVLFEMLTGQRAFIGDDASDTLATVLRATVGQLLAHHAVRRGDRAWTASRSRRANRSRPNFCTLRASRTQDPVKFTAVGAAVSALVASLPADL